MIISDRLPKDVESSQPAHSNLAYPNLAQGKAQFFRYGAILPLAAVLTTGLMLTMAALIATEFTPQDKAETATFEINPVVEDIPDPIRKLKLDPLQEVDVPPPPPKLSTEPAEAVDLPIIKVAGKITEFEIDDLDFGESFETVQISKDPSPIARIPPVFPPRFAQGDVSGYCRVRFDINPEGRPFNVTATLCTNRLLKSPTVKSVQKWNYTPEIRNGRAISRSGLETTIRFDLADERGKILPLPSGF